MKCYFYQNKLPSIILFLLASFSSVSLGSNVETLLEEARALIKVEKIEKAHALLESIADEEAGNAEFDYLYGLLLQKMAQYSYSVFVLERASFIRPQHVPTQVALAKAYIHLKEFSKAEKIQQQLEKEQATTEAANIKQLEQQKK